MLELSALSAALLRRGSSSPLIGIFEHGLSFLEGGELVGEMENTTDRETKKQNLFSFETLFSRTSIIKIDRV